MRLSEATITDLDFADDVVMFAELVDCLVRALEVLSEEAEPSGLRVSWLKIKLQFFDNSVEEAIEPCSHWMVGPSSEKMGTMAVVEE